MENQLVLDRIESLRGRRGYEEKKAAKLGFSSLYEYFEDKIAKETKAVGVKTEFSIKTKPLNQAKEKKQTSCSCC
tara:strand:+ start:655 stop:879 length:225 start_codon:yes stop_codon:yes gene_type:complete